jgi:hypothetical protein
MDPGNQIQTCIAELFPLSLRKRRAAWLCSCGNRRHPGVSGAGVTDHGDDGLAVFAGDVEVAADRVTVAGGGLGAEPAGELLRGFRRALVAFALVRGRGDPQVGQEPQDVVFAVSLAFQQRAAGLLLRVRAGNSGSGPGPGTCSRRGSGRGAPPPGRARLGRRATLHGNQQPVDATEIPTEEKSPNANVCGSVACACTRGAGRETWCSADKACRAVVWSRLRTSLEFLRNPRITQTSYEPGASCTISAIIYYDHAGSGKT